MKTLTTKGIIEVNPDWNLKQYKLEISDIQLIISAFDWDEQNLITEFDITINKYVENDDEDGWEEIILYLQPANNILKSLNADDNFKKIKAVFKLHNINLSEEISFAAVELTKDLNKTFPAPIKK